MAPAPAPAPTTRWPGLVGAVIALLVVAVVVGNRVWGVSSQVAINEPSTAKHNTTATRVAFDINSRGLEANGTLQHNEFPLQLYCNITSACTICTPIDECTGFRCARFQAAPQPPVARQVVLLTCRRTHVFLATCGKRREFLTRMAWYVQAAACMSRRCSEQQQPSTAPSHTGNYGGGEAVRAWGAVFCILQL